MWIWLQLVLFQTLLGQAFGSWSYWGPWAICTVPCGGGIQSRVRFCDGGLDCVGTAEEVRECETGSCSTGMLSPWGPFSPCSASCGGGIMLRTRVCVSEFQPVHCTGNLLEAHACSTDSCPPTGGWLEWSAFSPCSNAWGGRVEGVKSRSRLCNESECAGLHFDVQPCTTVSAGPAGEWSPFSPCTATCGNGVKTRSRTCPDSADHRCKESSNEVNSCFIRSCPESNCTYLDLPSTASGSVKDSSDSRWKVLIESVGCSCLGTLISKEWILTAGHCVGPDTEVYVGIGKYADRRCMRTKMEVGEIIKYSDSSVFGDLALLKLKEPIEELPDSEISNMPSGLSTEVGSACTAIAGSMEENPQKLFLEVKLTILPWDTCIASYGNDEIVGMHVNESKTLLCAGPPSQTEGKICRGYSGGALTCKKGGQKYVAGVSSFGAGDGCKNPGVYVDVEKYSEWIKNLTNVTGYNGKTISTTFAGVPHLAVIMMGVCWTFIASI